MSNELSHHGIKGMRWGIRRYQNSDGSLTPQGRLRYHYSTGAKLNKDERKQQREYEAAPGTTSYQKRQNVRSNKPFQEADRTDLTKERTIPKGTTFYRTSVNPKGDSSGDRYMTYLEVDRNLYKGGAIKFQANGKDTYETTYTLNKDLKIPSRERQKCLTLPVLVVKLVKCEKVMILLSYSMLKACLRVPLRKSAIKPNTMLVQSTKNGPGRLHEALDL